MNTASAAIASTREVNKIAVSKILVIHNPASGQQDQADVQACIKNCLQGHDIDCTIRQTKAAGDAQTWASTASKEGFDAVLAAGGDGTVIECLSGIIAAQSELPLMIAPLGTGNMLARTIDIALDLETALEQNLTGKCESFDIGHVLSHDRYFVISAGIGIDAQVIQDANRQQKRRWGFLAYVSATLKHLFTRRNRRINLRLDGQVQHFHAHTVLAFNSGAISLAGMTFGPKSAPHDGWLHVAVLEKSSSWETLGNLWHIFTRTLSKQAAPPYFKVTSLHIETQPPMQIQADGDIIGSTPAEINVLPDAVTLIVPQDYRRY